MVHLGFKLITRMSHGQKRFGELGCLIAWPREQQKKVREIPSAIGVSRVIAERIWDIQQELDISLVDASDRLQTTCGEVSNILRKEMDHARPLVDVNGPSFCNTATGLTGRVPHTAKVGDLTVMLLGSDVPLVLRRDGDGYILIGWAYGKTDPTIFYETITYWLYQVHGIMDGESLEGDTREFATFAIH